MSVISDAAVSRGDLSKRLDALEARLDRVETARRAEATAVGRNGVRVHSGGSARLEGGGSLLVDDGGDVRVAGGQVIVQDPSGAETFLAGTDGLTLSGLLQVLGGRIQAVDSDGDDVFVVGTDPPSIFMRKALISSLVDELVEELLVSPAGQELAAFVIGQRVHAAEATSLESTSSGTFVALPGGPVLTNVEVSDSGKLVVLVGGEIIISADQGASMSFEVSGATAVAPSSNRAQVIDWQDPDVGSLASRAMAGVVLDVNPGSHTIAARYNQRLGSGSVSFINRSLIAIAL